MPENDVSLDILIKTLADTQGAAAVQQSLDRIKQSGEKAAPALHEAGKKVELFNTHGKDMHKLVHSLNEVVPGLGLVLRAAVHPAGIGIAATVMLFRELVKEAENYNKRLEETSNELGTIKADVWKKQEDGIHKAADEEDKYAATLKKLGEGADDLVVREQNLLTILEKQLAIRKELAKGIPGKEDAVETQGSLEKIQLLEGTQKEQAAQGAAAEMKLKGIRDSRSGLAEGADQSTSAQSWQGLHGDDLKKAYAELEKVQTAAKNKKPKELREMADRLPLTQISGPGGDIMVPGSSAEASYLRQQAEEIEKAEQHLKQLQSQQRAASAAIASHDRNAKAIDTAESEAVGNVTKWAAASQRTGLDIEKEKTIFGIEGAGRYAKQLQGAGIEPYNRAGHSMMGIIEAEGARGRGEQLDRGQIASMEVLRRAERGAGLTKQSADNLERTLQNHLATIQSKIAAMERAFHIQAVRISTANSYPQ